MREPLNPSSELFHFGIRNMKWGVNRYQLSDGTWTEEGLERRRAREGFGSKKQLTKDQVINSGNAKLVGKFREQLTTQELRAALDRIDTNARLDAALNKPRKDFSYNAARVANSMLKTTMAVSEWAVSKSGQMVRDWATGNTAKKQYWDYLIRHGNYDEIKRHMSEMPVEYQKRAYDALSVRYKYDNRIWETDKKKKKGSQQEYGGSRFDDIIYE